MSGNERQTGREIGARAVLLGAVAIACGVLLAALASWLLWRYWEPAGPDAASFPVVAPPALQSAPQREREQYFADKRRLLESWQWIDQQAGIARIPIEQAMQIMAARSGTASDAKGAR